VNSSPRLRRGEVPPSAARRRRGPAPTGCVRCATRATRSSNVPSASRTSFARNSSPRLRRGEVPPSAARRRRGPAPTGCVRCATRATRSSNVPSASRTSFARNSSPRLRRGEVPPSAARRRGGGGDLLRRVACAARRGQPVHRTSPPPRELRSLGTSPTSLRSVEEEFRSEPARLRGLRNSSAGLLPRHAPATR